MKKYVKQSMKYLHLQFEVCEWFKLFCPYFNILLRYFISSVPARLSGPFYL